MNWLKVERERVAAWASIAVGGVCLIAGWFGVSGTKETYQQITYIVSGGISSLFFLGLGVGLLVSADLHDEWRKMDRLERALEIIRGPQASTLYGSEALNGVMQIFTKQGAPHSRPRVEAMASAGLIQSAAYVYVDHVRLSIRVGARSSL